MRDSQRMTHSLEKVGHLHTVFLQSPSLNFESIWAVHKAIISQRFEKEISELLKIFYSSSKYFLSILSLLYKSIPVSQLCNEFIIDAICFFFPAHCLFPSYQGYSMKNLFILVTLLGFKFKRILQVQEPPTCWSTMQSMMGKRYRRRTLQRK